MEWKILITDGLESNGIDLLEASAQVDDRSGINPADLMKIIARYDALIVRGQTKVTAELIAAAEQLKAIGRAGVGVDNIDLEAARVHGVVVVNTPASTTTAVAELAFGLMLALGREIPRADAAMKQGQWLKKDFSGVELLGKTLGIIGLGRIGAEVGRRAKAFGMAVVGHDPLISDEDIRDRGAEPVSLPDLYGRSDFISLHVPLTGDTKGMISSAAFAQMKPGIRIVCAARGGVIDEQALLSALENGIVAGAALDVFSQEPPGLTPLVSHPKVIATPHIGAQTEESQAHAAADIASEILAALKGEPLRWQLL